jgi:carboxymethylenebutenolidase
MCDQDHFENDRQVYEKLGLVTRKQFGVALSAGMAMMLPQVANAATVTESDVNVKTPDGTADCYFVHPANGTAAGVLIWPDIFGLRPAFRQIGKRLAQSGYSVLVVNPFYRTKKAPTSENAGATPIEQVRPLAQTLSETTHDGCESVHRMAGRPVIGCKEQENRHARVLYGRPDRISHSCSRT